MLEPTNPYLKDDQDAILLLWKCGDKIRAESCCPQEFHRHTGLHILLNAIRHIARPEQYWYPKSRRGTKRRPVTHA